MGKTRMVFINPGANVNSSYYCNIVLEKGLLPDIRAIMSSLQVDTACSRMKRQRTSPGSRSMDYLKNEHINVIEPHIGPQNSSDINPVDYAI